MSVDANAHCGEVSESQDQNHRFEDEGLGQQHEPKWVHMQLL